MADESRQVELGRRIAAWRVQYGLSQGAISRRAGIHASYLSRIENGRVHPTVRTAARIADAMHVSLNDLLGPSPTLKDRPCPVSVNGSCLVDLIDARGGKENRGRTETYSVRQIRLLRRFMSLLREGNPSVTDALEVIVNELLTGRQAGRKGDA